MSLTYKTVKGTHQVVITKPNGASLLINSSDSIHLNRGRQGEHHLVLKLRNLRDLIDALNFIQDLSYFSCRYDVMGAELEINTVSREEGL